MQSACLHLSFVIVHYFRSLLLFTIYHMAPKETYLATELDRARGCNLEDSNSAALIVDYFVLDDSEASSDEQWGRRR